LDVFTKTNTKVERKTSNPYKTKDQDGKLKNDESLLERLIFENPKLFPVGDIADSGGWIPLVTQLDIRKHGILDILATDNDGHIYIVECKLSYNTHDMKIIRGQISDYVSGLWARKNSEYGMMEEKFEEFWKWFCKEIEKGRDGKKLENILEEFEVDSIDDTIELMKRNFKEDKIICVFAVDAITEGLRESVKWHNNPVNGEKNNYPMFILEVKRYENDREELIVTQTFPANLDELKTKINSGGKSSPRVKNDEDSWIKSLKQHHLKHEKEIITFVNQMSSLVEEKGGEIDWGSGAINPRAMPAFSNYTRRKPIGIKANGECVLQFELFQDIAEYEELGREFEKRINEIDDIRISLETRAGGGFRREPWVKHETWLPHADEILSILKSLFVTN
jgi:hypothetical protein